MNRNHFRPDRPPGGSLPLMPSAQRGVPDSGVHRSEVVLFLLLVGSVGFAFAHPMQTFSWVIGHVPAVASLVTEIAHAIV